MNENDTIAIYEYFENLGYHREMIRFSGGTFSIHAFGRGRALIYGKVIPVQSPTYPDPEQGYYIVTYDNGEFHDKWYYPKEGKENILPKRFHEFRPTMTEVHDGIFRILSDKYEADNKSLFRMRSRNNKGRYDKGYWFLGNDDFLVLSFWAGTDWKNKTPNIWLELNIQKGLLRVEYVGRTDDATATFLENLASVNNLEQVKQKGNEVNRWERTIFSHWQGDYIKAIEKFIQTEKVIIDTFLKAAENEKQDLGDFGSLSPKDFNKLYKRLNKLRANQNLAIEQRPKAIDYTQEPIELKQLQLDNIGHFVQLKIDLSPRVICIFGQNGIGKTTVLRALLLALTGVDETAAIDMNSKNLQRLMKIKGTNEVSEIIYERAGKITLDYHQGEAVQNTIHFNPRKNNTVEISDEIGFGEEDMKPSFTATFDNGLYTQLIIGFAQVHGRKVLNETEEKANKKANVTDILPLIYDVEDNRFENLSGWIINLYADAKVNERQTDLLILEMIFKVVSKVTDVAITFKTVDFKAKLIWVTLAEAEGETQEIMFSLLSQGYKNVFAWVGHFVKRLAEANDYAGNFKTQPAIVVIDEIDTYLHPLWQRNILNVLAKEFINTQFIVTTHSPLVANHLEEKDKAVYIIRDKGLLEKVEHIQGVNLKDAFYSWMRIPYRDERTTAAIQEIFRLINSDELKKAKKKLADLERQIGNDGDLVRAKTQIELSENFDSDFDDADFDFDN